MRIHSHCADKSAPTPEILRALEEVILCAFLKNEFAECSGGKFHIGRFKSLSINQRASANMKGEFQINVGDKNQIFFESRTGENVVLSDLIENLEIVTNGNQWGQCR